MEALARLIKFIIELVEGGHDPAALEEQLRELTKNPPRKLDPDDVWGSD